MKSFIAATALVVIAMADNQIAIYDLNDGDVRDDLEKNGLYLNMDTMNEVKLEVFSNESTGYSWHYDEAACSDALEIESSYVVLSEIVNASGQ